MKIALILILSLSALAAAGPTAFNKNTIKENDVNTKQYMQTGDFKQNQATETLKQWCFSSQMSQPELTASFKKLVSIVESGPADEQTEQAVMSERICQGALVAKSAKNGGETIANTGADVQAHELIKDVYMDALIACESRECLQQLVKIIDSKRVDPIRASYYMTRVAVAEKDTIKDESQLKTWVDSFTQNPVNQESEAIERQKMLATSSIVGKFLKNKDQSAELKQTTEQLVKTIVNRFIRPVSQQEVQQYKQDTQSANKDLIKKIAKRNSALKALANIPGYILTDVQDVEQILIELAQNKQELVTVRQSAIECLQHNDKVYRQLKQLCFEQDEPIEVRIAALRTLMTVVWVQKSQNEQQKQQIATEIVDQLVKHCEEQRNQQQDDQFVLYAISYLDNLRTSQEPEHQSIKEIISKNKQHYMQIQLLVKKFKQQLNDIRRSSRNYKLEQEFNQIDSGLVVEGDLIYESKQKQDSELHILPKLVRVNMSMPIMGETVNVVEITLRQHQMDEQMLSTLKLVKDAKFNSESVSKVVDSFKQSVEKQPIRGQKESAEADLTIKVDGCTVVYVCLDDFKTQAGIQMGQHQRNQRSVHYTSVVQEILEHLKRNPIAFNRGFNFNFNERIAKALDVEANIIAGLRFESRASGSLNKDMEIVAQIEPRFAFEAIVGPAKLSSKKLMQRVSTKTALGLRLRYKQDELVDFQIDLPMNMMELFTFETQLVEKSQSTPYSYNYLPESIYGQEDIYAPLEEDYLARQRYLEEVEGESGVFSSNKLVRKMKRSIFEKQSRFDTKSIVKFMQGKQRTFAYTIESPDQVARMTGLRGKLRVVGSPKDMSFLIQAIAQKYEPSMQGYRFQIQKSQRSSEQQQYVLTISTPGSRVERSVQWRAIVQQNNQRTIVKSDIQTPKMSSTFLVELIHDARQYAIKTELVMKQQRHMFECGVQRNSQPGRIATSYKPYLTLQSSLLKRPIQMQGVVSYQQQPKTVISWELKCPTSGDFVQGKMIFDLKDQQTMNKRSYVNSRRSMRSPVELIFERDLTVTAELVGQLAQHAVKVHKMLDWQSVNKLALNTDFTVQHKDTKRSASTEIVGQIKLDKEQQLFTVQRKSPQQPREEFRFVLSSDNRQPQVHQLSAELRYTSGRGQNELVAYKHKLDIVDLSARKVNLNWNVELLASELNLNEKVQARTEATFDRKLKTIRCELASRQSNKSIKLNVDFESLAKHHIECQVQYERVQHKTVVLADQRVVSVQSRTELAGQEWAKIVMELMKQQDGDCTLVVEFPTENVHCAVDLKLNSAKRSSWAIQTPRFSSKAEFEFEWLNTNANKRYASNWFKQPFQAIMPFSSLRFKTDLKDLMSQENYWMDSAYNHAQNQQQDKSYFRFESPIYRSDIEFEPRQSETKFAMFARTKRSTTNKSFYTNEESALNQMFDFNSLKSNVQNKLNLGSDKMWLVRSIVSPRTMNELKQQAQRALFEYADRRQQHKHQINYLPGEQRVQFQFEHEPTSYQPTRVAGDFSSSLFSNEQQINKPSSLSMESEWVDFDLDMKPFDGQESGLKWSALSRHPRSAFKKHESEIKYNKQQGYRAHMKHQDREDKHHSWELEADQEPKRWAKLSMDSDKYGKAKYEHNWRKNLNKRSDSDQEVYSNKVDFFAQSPRNTWTHKTQMNWEEPMSFARKFEQRVRRDVYSQDNQVAKRYSLQDYLEHVSARLNSQTMKNQAQWSSVDFDYKPSSHARLNMNLPNEISHSTSFEYQPTESLYKIQSRLVDERTKQPYYQMLASTKPVVANLATSEQEPLFFNHQHPMLERPISADSYAMNLFKQPMKLDYSDKYGRVARLDYDWSPIGEQKYLGLRQKRAAVYYKDDASDFEHESSFDFYPEQILARGFKTDQQQKHYLQGKQQLINSTGDFQTKFQTKYGQIVVRCESSDKVVEIDVQSPIVNAKISAESAPAKRGAKLIKVQLDNKNQKVQLAKLLRKSILSEIEPIVEFARKFDQTKFEHQTELLVSYVEAIFKLKSMTYRNQRAMLVVEGELNKQEQKLIVKIDGERAKGQLVCDLVTGSSSLVLDVDEKRTVQHMTRLVRKNDKFFHLESVTSYKQQPWIKLNAEISSMVFEEPMHFFQIHSRNSNAAEHVSTFDAVIYEPKKIVVEGKYDCYRKEAQIVYKDVESQKVSDVQVKYDIHNADVKIDARCSSPRGAVYQFQKVINVRPLVEAY